MARNLGCEPTKHFKQLSKGVSVTLDDGNIVTSEMVTEPALPAQAFMIIFLPDESFMQSFLAKNNHLFEHFAQNQEKY